MAGKRDEREGESQGEREEGRRGRSSQDGGWRMETGRKLRGRT